MSAREWLHAAVMAHLEGDPALAPLRIYDAPPPRAGGPYAVVEDPELKAWDAAALTGRAGRLAVSYRDPGERPGRLRPLIDAVEAAMERLPDMPGDDGWRLAGLTLARSRLAAGKDGWTGRSEWLVRIYRANG